MGQGTAVSDLPEVKRVREMQKNISSVLEETIEPTNTCFSLGLVDI